ncbi:MAG: MFS transporter [Proteobacteria bacterium]|nr:MFS transporter [Pseudomonadota bacterium]
MNRLRVILALALTFAIFAILLNSVGTVILQSFASFGIGKTQASNLELFKDLSIALASLLLAAYLPRLGYKRAMMSALALVGIACVVMRLYPSFHTAECLFLCTGIGFAVAKVSVYSSIGLLTRNPGEHARLTNLIEAQFMLGVLVCGWLFSAFIDDANPANPVWFNVYGLLAVICAAVIALLATSTLDESAAHDTSTHASTSSFADMLRLFLRPLVCVFLICAFLCVLIEQSFSTWLPSFNHAILKLSHAMSIRVATLLAGALALGRLLASQVLRRVPWYVLLNVCIVGMGVVVMVVLPLARDVIERPGIGWFDAPIAAYLIPLIGLLMAPIYPVINSVALSALPKASHAGMTGLIVIFSALGGTLGSRLTAMTFAAFDGIHAFYLSLLPMSLMLVALYFFKRETDRIRGG